MKPYDVYQHPAKGYQAVKEGFSWPGFFFGWMWCLIKGLFGWGLGALAVSLLLSLVTDSEPILWAVTFLIAGIIGVSGNGWRCEKLQNRGYSYVARVQARNAQSAVAEALKASDSLPTRAVA